MLFRSELNAINIAELYELCSYEKAWGKIHMGGFLFCANRSYVRKLFLCLFIFQDNIVQFGADTTCLAGWTQYVEMVLAASRTTLFEGGGEMVRTSLHFQHGLLFVLSCLFHR